MGDGAAVSSVPISVSRWLDTVCAGLETAVGVICRFNSSDVPNKSCEDFSCACYLINFSDRQNGSTVPSE